MMGCSNTSARRMVCHPLRVRSKRFFLSILVGVKGTFSIIDDIVVHGKDAQQHNQRLNEVLSLLNEYHLSLNTGRFVFSATEVEFFGYSVSVAGVRPLAVN